MRIQETKVYQFDELTDSAKERARDWYRQGIGEDTYWCEFVLEDAQTIAQLLGIELSTRTVRLMNNTTRQEPVIWWSLDRESGACFSARYRYAKGCKAKLAQHIGDESKGDKTLHAIAQELTQAQKSCGYRGIVDVTARDRSMTISCEDVSEPGLKAETFDKIESALQDFAHWIYSQLQAEWNYQNSDECVDESIQANEYEFTEEGERA